MGSEGEKEHVSPIYTLTCVVLGQLCRKSLAEAVVIYCREPSSTGCGQLNRHGLQSVKMRARLSTLIAIAIFPPGGGLLYQE